MLVFTKQQLKGKKSSVKSLRMKELITLLLKVSSKLYANYSKYLSVNIYSKFPLKNCIMPVKGFYFDNESFYIFYPIKKSLFSLLHESIDAKILSYEQKIQLVE